MLRCSIYSVAACIIAVQTTVVTGWATVLTSQLVRILLYLDFSLLAVLTSKLIYEH
jgi:hypothetical protein